MSEIFRDADDPLPVLVATGSRLHFGLFDVRVPFGGVGLMIDHPRTVVTVDAGDRFEVSPCPVERVREIAVRIAARLPEGLCRTGLPRCRVKIEAMADWHCGLGSGTQLALATAVAISEFFGLELSRQELVEEIASRGRRSAIGSIGFFEGGLIAEDGSHHAYEAPGATWSRTVLPETWRVVLASAGAQGDGVSGEAEGAAFAALPPASPEYRQDLVRLAGEIVHAGRTADFEAFSVAVSTFNARSGQLFSAQQGGCFNGPAVEALVERIKSLGIMGVGQSSWGPTVFAFCQSEPEALNLRRSLEEICCRIVKPQATPYCLSRSPRTSCR
ncbi:MAG: beta-ribofuranosylaminobenzene 5'-phosphate synthase [Planctomycetaceae bacterium]